MSEALEAACVAELDSIGTWVISVSILPIVLGFLTLIIVFMTVWKVKKMVKICESITSGAHWLSRTAVRVGIGATAKQTLTEYAKSKPELARLINLK